jgi:hypothetical protein
MEFNDEPSKTLIIYIKDSHYKYYDLYSLHLFNVDGDGFLSVLARDPSTGEESSVACFRNWDYFIID